MSSPLSRAEDHSAGRRNREVYRYFRPERLCPIDEDSTAGSDNGLDQELLRPSATSASRGRSPCSRSQSPNPPTLPTEPVANSLSPMPESLVLGDANTTLNSFAQLAALRLGVDRAFISVSDRDSQYIIAQGGQTVESTTKYDSIGEGLYAGCSTLDISTWSMCQDTVALPQSDRGQGKYNFVVSDDMAQDERYQHLPLVKEKPNFRFYAGTPLTTDSNINVGCLFVLDTKPHSEFSSKDKVSMGHMAMLIMDFLKVSRQASEGRRAARLLRGINHFVEGRSTLVDDTGSTGSLHPQSADASRSRKKSRHRRNSSVSSLCSRSSSSSAHSFSDSEPYGPSSSSSYSSANPSEPEKSQSFTDNNMGNSWTFRRAANIIRESLELGGDSGVAFFEAGNDFMLDRNSDSELSSSFETGKSASLLGLSTANCLYGPFEDSATSYPVSNMDEEFLHRLLNRYHQGRIWSLHRDGQLSSSDSEDGSQKRSTSRRNATQSVPSKGSKRWKFRENNMLNQYFPGATQVMFVPLWSPANSQWFGGFFCWNNVESDVFDPSVELSSLLSFGSSIMSECSRVESLISDRQKADFLGSISHELRSPLHGVLAAAEILQGSDLSQYQSSLMDTVNACGRTLLDTMNQVLDYSKILSLEKRFRHLDRRMISSLERKSMHRSAAHLDKYAATDLSLIAEEVVDGVCLGQHHIQNFSSSSHILTSIDTKHDTAGANPSAPKVKITLDISPNDWVYNIPPGAIRRIIMNIFSNAIKYTEAGHISMRLEADSSSSRHNTQEDMITLTVSDTGKGISEEFLRSRLFVPFIQEDSLASGSGLGLSIVRSLLKPLGGNISFQSKPGVGTTVKVTLPLVHPEQEFEAYYGTTPPPAPERPALSTCALLREKYAGRTVAFEDVSDKPSWDVLSSYLTDWFGLKVVSPSSKAPLDIIFLESIPSEGDASSIFSDQNSSFFMLSDYHIAHDLIQVVTAFGPRNVHVINSPCGPHKLARILKGCLDGNAPNITRKPIVLPERSSEQAKPADATSEDLISEKETQATDTAPAVPAQQAEPPTNPTSETPEAATEKPGARILVVEDNKINLNLMLAFLKKRGLAALDSAENGKAAVSAVKEEQQGYDIIFMDISMPVMNGFEAARTIRAFEKGRGDGLKRSKIIALTGLSSVSDEMEALDSGINLFLTKPVAFKEVQKILDRWDRGESDPEQEDADSE
ncbi:uncharacterized protein N7484_007105 [Penicillium longicatenatum]|uniref:uncharacterized protein n=1 Tax=Penicillium longicatenatum TaxID=1561947 RepID=UPI002547E282|nr:uncharacterized protein N7484_007105 [Penicillium longicatenatum]KAJ5639243.1 hypothetical protein N7484_007105 [Penicillium longicatenatum]